MIPELTLAVILHTNNFLNFICLTSIELSTVEPAPNNKHMDIALNVGANKSITKKSEINGADMYKIKYNKTAINMLTYSTAE